MASEAGQRVGDYEVLALLGSGGMGRVYKVRSVISGREEAMKILLPDFAAEPELAARFMAEIRTLAGLDHPNITQLRTAFQIQNQFVMVMEFVEGTTLDKLSAQLPLDQVLDYSMQVLSALSYAHGKGVTHRDIKPANIMITTHGVVKLMDFGIAKSTTDMNLTRPGTTMGSIYYMSPEQVRGGAVDGRTDIYSFGVTLYEMLTGRKPFQAETSYSVLNAQLNEAPAPPVQLNPSLSPELNEFVLRAMAKDPAARFQSADEFRNALKSVRERKAAAAPGPVAVPVAAPSGFAAATRTAGTGPQPFQQTVVEPAPVSAPPPNQGFTPVAVPAAPRAAANKSHRGLWIGLGALAAVLAIVAAATVLPRFYPLHAGGQKTLNSSSSQMAANTSPSGNPADSNVPPSTPPATAPQQPSSPQPQPATAIAAPASGVKPAVSHLQQVNHAANAALPQPRPMAQAPVAPLAQGPSVSAPPAVPAGPTPEEIRRARDRFMDLDARAETVRSSVEQLRRQQQAQGLDLRGDMLGAVNRMNNALREADRAINDHNLEVARDYMERANSEIQKLESFLGR